MGNILMSWQMAIGNFYNCAYSLNYGRNARVLVAFNLKTYLSLLYRKGLSVIHIIYHLLLGSFNCLTTLSIFMLVLLSGDIELNPGTDLNDGSVSILHCNTRSIRNKLEYIRDNFLDFEILCFTETHLDFTVPIHTILLSDTYDTPYREDRTNHGGGILTYVSNQIIHKHRPDLEIFF